MRGCVSDVGGIGSKNFGVGRNSSVGGVSSVGP